jgi:glutathione S-transferase
MNATAEHPQITLWGRTNSMNVQKVLWVLDALGLPYQRIDAGMQFGVNNTPEYLAMNPNGKIPLLKDGDFTIWESSAICRYLCNQYQSQALYPQGTQPRALVDQWIDWGNTTLFGPLSTVFWQMLRVPDAQRDLKKVQEESAKVVSAAAIMNQQLSKTAYLAGAQFTLADLNVAAAVFRCLGLGLIQQEDPNFASLMAWYDRVRTAAEFKRWIEKPLT